MAEPTSLELNTSLVGEVVWGSMPPDLLNSFGFLLNIAKAISIVFLIYLAFLIVRSVIQAKQALRMKSIEKEIKEINKKLDHMSLHKKGKD